MCRVQGKRMLSKFRDEQKGQQSWSRVGEGQSPAVRGIEEAGARPSGVVWATLRTFAITLNEMGSPVEPITRIDHVGSRAETGSSVKRLLQ